MVGVIIQARMESERLPGKSMMELCGKPILAHVVERTQEAVPHVCIATTPCSREIIAYALRNKIPYILDRRPRDVLDTFYRCASLRDMNPIVRITADNPLIEPSVIKRVVNFYYESKADWAANCRLKTTFPIGDDCEVFSFKALELAWKFTLEGREHVTPFIYNHPEMFNLAVLENDTDRSSESWTIDTKEDFERVRKIMEGKVCRIQG